MVMITLTAMMLSTPMIIAMKVLIVRIITGQTAKSSVLKPRSLAKNDLIAAINPDAQILSISAKTGEGSAAWLRLLRHESGNNLSARSKRS